MSIQKIATNAWTVSHCGQATTFLMYDFIGMVLWARNVQRLHAMGV